jgi:predicted dehydrogenase
MTMKNKISRREFVKTTAVVSAATMLSKTSGVFAAGSDKIRVGLIGCGDRGTEAAMDCIRAADGVELVAMADLFKDKLDNSLTQLKEEFSEKVKVTRESSFVGFDAYRKLVDGDVDMVILACPPGFRPRHLKTAIEAGKHVFMEKPAGVDPAGVRSVIESSELARKKGLGIVAGTQRRHQAHYREIMKRIHNGDIGQVLAAQCYWNGDMVDWHYEERKPGWSDMEWQVRCWPFFTWLSGDHMVEQHVHNLDVVNWALQAHPVSAMGMGGREVRTDAGHGNIFDHFAVEYEYPNGVRVLSMCRQMIGCTNRVSESIVGSKGMAYTDSGNGYIKGRNSYKYRGESPNPYEREHADLIESIRHGEPLNEGRQFAESTLTGIMGRMSAYTGRALKWDWVMNASELDLSPAKYEFGDLPVRPVAVPGKTELV